MKILCYSLLSFVLFYHLATNDLDSLQKNVLNKEYVHISVADSRFLLEKQPLHEVPVLCFHNIKGSLRGHWPALTITDDQFMKQIKMLADSGYHSILPDQLYNYLSNGGPLPHKPVMITFDDAYAEHFSIAAPVLEQYGFRGVFFIMTIVMNKPGYLSVSQIKELSDKGHVIASHSFDHPDLRRINAAAWNRQIDRTREELKLVTGKSIDYLAYPYGAWNEKVISELKKRGIRAAFQLDRNLSKYNPVYTIRRIQVSGSWSPSALNKVVYSAFR